MNKKVLLVVVGLVVLVLLGILASQVGGIAIRRTSTSGDEVRLSIPGPVLPGVETAVRFTAPSGLPNSEVAVRVRSSEGENTIGEGRLGSGSIKVVFPCNLSSKSVSVTLWDMRTSQLLASQEVDVLAAGPDCFQ